GGLFATTATARSKRPHASGSNSRPPFGVDLAMTTKPDLQKLAEAMSIAIGNANTTWARVENAMAGLLEWLLGYSTDNVALHVYFAPSNTETRFKIVDAAVQVKWKNYSTHDLLAEWVPIYESLGRAKEI